METRESPCHKRLKTQQDGSLCIPDDLLDNIFSFLPINDAVKTGILSTRFKKSWHISRRLNFDRSFANGRSRIDFISIVNKVFYLHSGSVIESFSLCFDPSDESKKLVEKWVKEASTKGVKELDLDFCPARMTTIQPCFSADLFDIKSLRILKLSYCNIVNLPPRFQGLVFLTTVILRLVYVKPRLVDALLSTCLLLETLDFANCTGCFRISARNLERFKVLKIGEHHDFSNVEINAPTLRSFHYSGPISILKLGDVSQLDDVLLNFEPSAGFTVPFQVFNIVNHVSNVGVLSSSCTFLEGLSPRILGGKWREMNYSFQNLKELQLFMEGASYCNPLDIVLFVKNCPSLNKLLIDLEEFSFDCGAYWDFHHRQLLEEFNPCFPSLELIKLSGFKFQQYEIKLATIFLKKAINLEKLVLVTAKASRNSVIAQENSENYKQSFITCKASIRAKIQVYEHFNDTSGLYPMHCKTWYNSFQ